MLRFIAATNGAPSLKHMELAEQATDGSRPSGSALSLFTSGPAARRVRLITLTLTLTLTLTTDPDPDPDQVSNTYYMSLFHSPRPKP